MRKNIQHELYYTSSTKKMHNAHRRTVTSAMDHGVTWRHTSLRRTRNAAVAERMPGIRDQNISGESWKIKYGAVLDRNSVETLVELLNLACFSLVETEIVRMNMVAPPYCPIWNGLAVERKTWKSDSPRSQFIFPLWQHCDLENKRNAAIHCQTDFP